MENHQDGRKHHHVALKLSRLKQWLSVQNELSTHYRIIVNFSEWHNNYYSTYKYITKADTEVFHNGEHPNLKDIGSPRKKPSKEIKNKRLLTKILCSSKKAKAANKS